MQQQVNNDAQPGCTADVAGLIRLYAGQTLFVLLHAAKVITKIANSNSEMKFFFKFILYPLIQNKINEKERMQTGLPVFFNCGHRITFYVGRTYAFITGYKRSDNYHDGN